MKYMISQLNREVDLNDELYSIYTSCDDLLEHPFILAFYAEYGELEKASLISDKELSDFCNKVLYSEIKALALLPKAIEAIHSHCAEFELATKSGELLEVPVE